MEELMRYWSKSALSLYRYLNTMADTIDRLVLDMGKNSNSAVAPKYHSTYYQANKIMELMDRKRKIVNLKVAIEDAVSKLSPIDRRIIMLVFFDGVRSETIAELLNMSLRTFFRHKASSVKRIADIMCEIGYDQSFFESEYFGEKWFMAVYNEIVYKGCDFDDGPDRSVVKQMFNEISRVNMAYNSYLS